MTVKDSTIGSGLRRSLFRHYLPEIGVHAGLVAISRSLQPSENVGIGAHGDALLLGAVKLADDGIGWEVGNSRDVREVDRLVGPCREA